MKNKTLVMKFGGAALANSKRIVETAKLIKTKSFLFGNIVVVVSAMGQMTDQLFELAYEIHPNPPKREIDMLVTTGERISISLLAMALDQLDVKAVSFTGSQSGIITSADHCDAKIKEVKPHRLLESFKEKKVVIVAGFQGVSLSKEITTLGRGGSDTSAVALGIALEAVYVEFFKDVDGFYTSDPKKNPDAKHLAHLDYDQAIKIANEGTGVLHPRCIELAKKNQMPLHVSSFDSQRIKKTTIWGLRKNLQAPIYEP
ncbi:hypothetical protein N9Y92_00895 [Chlamydiales bacterium]|nr:hypothetical protein [Chlamydiales bacterium]